MTIFPPDSLISRAAQLNHDCQCVALDRQRLRLQLMRQVNGEQLFEMVSEQRPHLLADSAVFVDESTLAQQQRIIEAIERVVAMPAYRQRVLAYAPASAHFEPQAQGVFLGYDFHVSEDGPRLIEINTNAGGALLNVAVAEAYAACGFESKIADITQKCQHAEQAFIEMFLTEWQLQALRGPLRTVAIVDDLPSEQYLLPEFLLFQNLFAQQGIEALICDPSALCYRNEALYVGERRIDLVYNRLTDFALDGGNQKDLREAYLAGNVVVTPHPHSHALYADKRNLCLLTDPAFLSDLGVDSETRQLLLSGVSRTQDISTESAESLWQHRKQLFFKPARGYGSKAAYRGDKLTRGVFAMILQQDYVAQALVPPSQRHLVIEGQVVELKLDLRQYVYRGQTQWICARLYQGQTTNFRTPGGGFAPVIVVPHFTPSPCGRGPG